MKNLKQLLTVVIAIAAVATSISLRAQIPFTPSTNARIAISSDGNKHDNDDWGATAATLAILAKAGLQNKVVLYTYSDHIWGSEGNDEAQMRESALGGKNRFGFNNTNFIEAVKNKEAAYNAMKNAINASSSGNRLVIICAGPMHVVGVGMSRATAFKRQFVTLISHSNWNDFHSDRPEGEGNHNGWTWNEMKNSFSNANFVHIKDQNEPNNKNLFNTSKAGPGGSADWASWHWMRDNSDANIRWVYQRAQALGRPDISDCGMAWYLVKNDQNGNATKMKNFINGGSNPPPPSGSVFRLQKRNASNYAIDGGNGGANGQNVYLWTNNPNNPNTKWVEISRGNGYFSYRKNGTNFCLDGGNGGANGQNVYLWSCGNSNQNQHWLKVNAGSGHYRLQKRNAPGFSIDGNNGGGNGQNLYLWSSSSTNQNQQWKFTATSARVGEANDNPDSGITIYPNPVSEGGILSVNVPASAANSELTITNVQGQLVHAQAINESGTVTIDLDGLTQGIYVVAITGSNLSYTSKIIIE